MAFFVCGGFSANFIPCKIFVFFRLFFVLIFYFCGLLLVFLQNIFCVLFATPVAFLCWFFCVPFLLYVRSFLSYILCKIWRFFAFSVLIFCYLFFVPIFFHVFRAKCFVFFRLFLSWFFCFCGFFVIFVQIFFLFFVPNLLYFRLFFVLRFNFCSFCFAF